MSTSNSNNLTQFPVLLLTGLIYKERELQEENFVSNLRWIIFRDSENMVNKVEIRYTRKNLIYGINLFTSIWNIGKKN